MHKNNGDKKTTTLFQTRPCVLATADIINLPADCVATNNDYSGTG